MNKSLLYKVKEDLKSVIESSDDKEKTHLEELEKRVEDIKKKKVRGFISEEEAEEDMSKVQKKVTELKEKLNDRKSEK
mgnify:CR=1 FL=1